MNKLTLKQEHFVHEYLPDINDTHETIREHLEERAAIMEYDGGLPRKQAEYEARKALRVFHYRLTDNPSAWLVLIAPDCKLDEATKRLRKRFGKRFVDVKEYTDANIHQFGLSHDEFPRTS